MRTNAVVTFLGNVFLRYGKGALPIVVLTAYSLALPEEKIFGSEHFEHVTDGLALAVVLIGLTLRAVTIGSARNVDGYDNELSVSGIYALSRNPLYLGSLLVCFGIFLMHGSPVVLLLGLAACTLIYAAMVRVEERKLLERYGEPYRDYCEKVPRWVPALSRVRQPGFRIDFNVRRALAKDWPTIVATAVALVLTEVQEALPPALAASSQTVLIVLSAGLVVVASLLIGVRAAAVDFGWERSPDRPLETDHGAGPQTRGIRVDGRVRHVDLLENLLSLGQQEAILKATLDAAALKPGDRLVDVGCGTGKLVVAAAAMLSDRHGGTSPVLGIDATPGIIDLAIERAHRAGVEAEFQVGVAEALPLAASVADAVTSSYFFHHLPSDVKREALREMWRVLRPGGRLVITDYGRARGLLGLIGSIPMRANFYEYVRSQLGGELEDIVEAEKLGRIEFVRIFLGYITVMRVVKPG